MENIQKFCSVCGKQSSNKCSGCKQVYYCCREHQKSHWKIHKKECAKMKKQEEQKPLELECAVCGISESSAHLKLCASCQIVAYCGKEHQLHHWRNGGHPFECSRSMDFRVGMSSAFARFVEDPDMRTNYPQFQTDSRFQQLEQDLAEGAQRTWLRHVLELFQYIADPDTVNFHWGQYHLGLSYEHGIGVKQDNANAMKWYRRAADQGNAGAQHNLGVCYSKGNNRDMSTAVKWWRKAADQGHGKAQCNLGQCYENGEGVPKDMSESVKWFRKAAEQGIPAGQVNLAAHYGNGEGVPKDMSEAMRWYRKAADQGVPEGQFNLGLGFEMEKKWNEAVKWYRRAADQGNADAQCHLGICYATGEGVPRNLGEAVMWL